MRSLSRRKEFSVYVNTCRHPEFPGYLRQPARLGHVNGPLPTVLDQHYNRISKDMLTLIGQKTE